MGKASLCPCLSPTSFEAQQNRSLGSREKLFPLSAANVEERLRMSKNVSAELKGFSWSRDFEV